MPIFNLQEGKGKRIGIFGSSGSGKSYLSSQLFRSEDLLMGKFSEIFLIHPEYFAESSGENWKQLDIKNIYTH